MDSGFIEIAIHQDIFFLHIYKAVHYLRLDVGRENKQGLKVIHLEVMN